MHITLGRVLKYFLILSLFEQRPYSSCQKVEMPLGSGARLTLTPNQRTVKKFVGDTYVISCINGASDTQWYFPSGAKVNDTKSKIVRVRQQLRRGGGGIDLFLQRVNPHDAGVYTCKSKNTQVQFNFVVVKPITFDNTMAHQTAPEKSTYTIKCQATGQSSTQPKLYWKVDGKSPQAPKYKVVKDGLIVNNVSKSDAKRSYICHAMDIDSPMPDVKSMNIMLHVARKPVEVTDDDDKSSGGSGTVEKWGMVGERANFTCRIDSDPIPSFEWFGPSGERLKGDNDEHHISNAPPLNGTIYSSMIQIRLAQEEQFGPYICRAGNGVGAVEKIFHLRKSAKPSTPFLQVDRVSPQEARVNLLKYKPLPGEESPALTTTANELPILDYIVESKLSQDKGSFYPAKFRKYDKGFILSGLLPATVYSVRAALKNSLGVGSYSPAVQIKTTETDEVATPTTIGPTTLITQEPHRFTIQKKVSPCPPNLFQCKNEDCISYSGKCNGISECSDGSDEDGEMCRIALNTPINYAQPPNIIDVDATEPTPAASRSIASHAKYAPITTAPPPRRLFYINGPNGSINSIGGGGSSSSNAPEEGQSSESISSSREVSSEETSPLPQLPPLVTSMNETSTRFMKNSNNTFTKSVTNTVTNVTKTMKMEGNSKRIIVTKKEIVITEIIE